MKNLTYQTKLGITVLVTALVAIVALYLTNRDAGDPPDVIDSSTVVRPDSHRLGEPGSSDVTFVEFLDFECEVCGAAYPLVEELRTEYAGRVTFVVRYFPIDSHRNARNAAHAVEAAARQGKFEQMYSRMFETQKEWGEQQQSQAALFRSYAEELGLDMKAYDTDVGSESVAKRVQKDVDDGLALGVSGTPTFYLDGERFQPQSGQDFVDAIDQALAE